ncbi:DNA/RNA helicase domain-containing protein [Streptomyces sp. ODS28]|uniref:DNA/RNA helicase domain-containing protein n=1 Tax=Streptomyces sp. ODS28 TaxID=3136688 RepID=UPI0031EB6567
MHVFAGTVGEASARVGERSFLEECAARYLAEQGREPGGAEVRSWERSWPRLVDALCDAGLRDLHLLLEYELPGTSQRVDALLLGSTERDTGLVAVAVELKQWTHAAPHPSVPGKLRVAEREVLHPARQVGCYVNYLRDWVPESVGLEVRGLAFLHDASADLVDGLRRHVRGGPSAQYPLLGARDVPPDGAPQELAAHFQCQDLQGADASRIRAFLEARHRPSASLLARAAADVSRRFPLIDEQDSARQEIHRAIRQSRGEGPGHIVAVTGGPGTGKTAIACRVFGELCEQPGANPRLLSPSGTLTQQLSRSIGESAKGLVSTVTTRVPSGMDRGSSVVLLDEAHRARTYPYQRRGRYPDLFGRLLRQCAVLVLFLDERQVVRPSEGTSLGELREMAGERNCTFAHVDLRAQFRCSGSRAYLDWVDALLSPDARPRSWRGSDYDLDVAGDPLELERWVNAHVAAGNTARVTAGFCWPWQSDPTPPLLPEVSISWEDGGGRRLWERPWNSRASAELAGDGVPGRAYWATDDGGQQQVGCVYTAQGMEYDYGAVILGEDLTWTPDGWRARPEKSHDPELRHLDEHRYLPYALNVYRVLMTRGARGTRLYSTDAATQRFLKELTGA